MSRITNVGVKCSSPFCDRQAYAGGMCINCYRRNERRIKGSVSKTVDKRRMDNMAKLVIKFLASEEPWSSVEGFFKFYNITNDDLKEIFKYAKENHIPMSASLLQIAVLVLGSKEGLVQKQ